MIPPAPAAPRRLLHGDSKRDEFYRAPLEWPSPHQTTNLENTFLKVAAWSKCIRPPQSAQSILEDIFSNGIEEMPQALAAAQPSRDDSRLRFENQEPVASNRYVRFPVCNTGKVSQFASEAWASLESPPLESDSARKKLHPGKLEVACPGTMTTPGIATASDA